MTYLDRREFLKLTAMATAGAAVAACTNGSVGSAPAISPGSTVTLKMVMISGTDTVMRKLETAFNDSSKDFKVNLDITSDSNENIKTTYRTHLSSQSPPDLSFIFTGQRFIADVAEAGLVTDLSKYDKKYGWSTRFDKNLFSDFPYKGKLFQIAYAAAPHAFVYYNKKLFSQLGLAVPANRRPSLDDFNKYISTSRGAGLEPIALGNKDKWPGGHFVTMMVSRAVPSDNLTALRQDFFRTGSKVKWTDSAPQEGLKFAQDAVKNGWFAKGLNAMADGEAASLFQTGKSTMYQSGFWALRSLPPAAPQLDFDFFHYPQLDKNVPIAIINFANSGFVISSKSKLQDQAAAFIDFTLSRAGQKILLENSAYPSTNLLKGATDIKLASPLWPDMLSEVATTPSNPFQIENDTPSSVAPTAMSAMQGLLDGSISPSAWGSQFQTGLDGSH